MNRLAKRLERLERRVPAAPCATCGASAGPALVGLDPGALLPAWIDEAGRCRACERRVRAYVGVDLALV